MSRRVRRTDLPAQAGERTSGKRDKRSNRPISLRFIPLGGSQEVTKNMYVYETADDLVVVDCGIGFPDDSVGENAILIPDFSYLLARRRKLRCLVVTHPHEDHYGAISYLLKQLRIPVYAPPLAVGFIQSKLKERGPKGAAIKALSPGERVKFGSLSFEFIRMAHSVPEAMAIVLKTPLGVVIHAADFKLDPTPLDRKLAELGKIKRYGQSGVLLLASDCLRAEREGHCSSERIVGETFFREMQRTNGRVFITLFSSDISRIQQAIDVSRALGRKVTLAGYSLKQKTEVARSLGYLNVPKNTIISNIKAKKLSQGEITVLAAGSQGQKRAAFTRMAWGKHPFFKIGQGDLVLFSSDLIPGNERAVGALFKMLEKTKAKVLYLEKIPGIHVSGHAYAEELREIILLAKAKYLLPIGGTPKSTQAYARLAKGLNYRQNQILLPKGGQVVEFVRRGDQISVRMTERISLKEIVIHQT